MANTVSKWNEVRAVGATDPERLKIYWRCFVHFHAYFASSAVAGSEKQTLGEMGTRTRTRFGAQLCQECLYQKLLKSDHKYICRHFNAYFVCSIFPR